MATVLAPSMQGPAQGGEKSFAWTHYNSLSRELKILWCANKLLCGETRIASELVNCAESHAQMMQFLYTVTLLPQWFSIGCEFLDCR